VAAQPAPRAAARPPASGPAPASAPAARAPVGVTFFVAADTHYGFEDVRDDNRRMIEEMNSLPGTPYPPELGGHVDRPLGVLVAGDLTENGRPAEWQQFEADFGLTGADGLLRYPVFEASGNHDGRRGRHVVRDGIRSRHRGVTYSWDWQGIHFASLDRYPSAPNRQWLAKDLARLRPHHPVVLFFHYNLEGPYSRYFRPSERAAFRDVIARHNVVAIFHGHYHPEQRYAWNGVDVFDVGSPFWDTTFAVVRITESHLQVASWNWIERRWGSLFRRPLAPRVAAAR
jgi:cytolysin (calcineurin-like family phosphatase)